MITPNPLNVFKGANALQRYFNPDEQPPLPLVELPEKLNPFRQDGVRIYAKMLTALPAQNVKALPALNMLLHEPSAATTNIIEVSSGSTVTSLGVTARVLYSNSSTTAFVSNKASLDRIRELQFFGVKVALYGGPTYTETTDPRGPVEWARRLGRDDSTTTNLGQYDNEYNWKSHERWTGPQIWSQLPEIDVFCMGMGSTGCVTGTGRYLKAQKPSVKILGVCNDEADLVPGPRERPMHETSPFPWKEVVDFTESVSSVASYSLSLRLSREGIIAGPSSGMALQGLYGFLQGEKDGGTLSRYADPATGEVSCVFIVCDLPQKHIDSYFQKLGPDAFPALINDELLAVDQHVYSFRWEIDPKETPQRLRDILVQIASAAFDTGSRPSTNQVQSPNSSSSLRVLDLRSHRDFEKFHLRGAYNAPFPDLSADSKSPFDFGDPAVLVGQCKVVEAILGDSDHAHLFTSEKSPLVVVCYNGNTSRIMVAMLRSRGVEAYSFRDGMPGVALYLNSQRACDIRVEVC